MELRHLRLVKSIVEEGSITKAISKLHLTQSALSHQLREAEEQLGTPIFHRINKKMVLTKAGEKYYETAKEILLKLSDAEHQIKKLVYGEVGELRLSTECFTSYYWLPPLMKDFQHLYPNVELKIVMEATHQPLEKLLEGKLDIAVTSDPISNEHIEYVELFQDEVVALVHSDHPWAMKKHATPEDFAHENLIIHSLPMETVSVYQQFLHPANVEPKKVTVLPFTEAAIQMVIAEMGVVAMAKWILKPYLKNPALRVVRIGKAGLKRTHYIAFLKNKEYPAYFTHFIEFLQREITLV